MSLLLKKERVALAECLMSWERLFQIWGPKCERWRTGGGARLFHMWGPKRERAGKGARWLLVEI